MHRLAPTARLPALDGVRAIAIVMVMLFHGDVTWARGGYLGVDVFFVLSGYLITCLLLHEVHDGGRIDIRAFWARRVRRIGPGLGLLLVGVAVYAATIARPLELVGLRRDGIAAVLQVANWRFALRGTSYFDALSPSLLQHTWSVSLEVQWYVVWPLALALLIRSFRSRDRALVGAIGLLALASAAECALLLHLGASDARLYYGTDTRMQALLVGAMLGAAAPPLLTQLERKPRAQLWADVIGIIGAVVLLLFMLVNPSRALLYRGGLLLVALAAAALVHAASGTGITARALSFAPLRAIGVISFGLYLWHWPIDVVVDSGRTGLSGVELFALRTALAFALATASYFLAERPARRIATAAGTRARLAALTGCVAAALAVSLVASTADAPAEQPSSTTKLALHVPLLIKSGTPRIFLAGDSQMFGLGWWGARVLYHDPRATFFGDPELGCGVLPERRANCAERDRKWTHALRQFDPDLTVLWIGAWEGRDFTIDRRRYHVGSRAHEQAIERAIDSIDGTVMRPDGVHFQSEPAAEIALRVLLPQIERLGRVAHNDRRALRHASEISTDERP